MYWTRRATILFLFLGSLFTTAVRAAETPDIDRARVDLKWQVKIPLRDGVKLQATGYHPADQRTPLPCIFSLTPYIADRYHERGMYFAANGYVYLNVDSRGRGNSEGEFSPYLQEANDGYDVVEWLAAQPYCNGKVAMWGASYSGYNQWTTAAGSPPHLATIVPAASVRPGMDFPATNNIFYPYGMRWATITSGRTDQGRLFGDEGFWEAKYREYYLQHRPFAELDRIIGNTTTRFAEWIAHPAVDDYWDSYNATAGQLAKLDLPILTITGQYDADQAGALAWYREHMQNATAGARSRHFLVIGPWDHPGTVTPRAEFGGLAFGDASLVDLNRLHKEWYDWTMKSGDRPDFLKAPVAYYVAGADEWRYADSLDAITASHEPRYLVSRTNPDDVFASGRLAPQPAVKARADRYVYDPLDTAPAADGYHATYLADQSAVLSNYTGSLIYHTAPFERDTELSGFFRFSAWISLDQPDTDISVAVYLIRPDGSSIFLADNILRARYRDSLREASLVPKNEILHYEFNRFSFISRLVKKGSRLRLVFGPLNSIYWQKNYNSGGVVAQESAEDARTVTVKLFQGPEYPSALYLPIAAASE